MIVVFDGVCNLCNGVVNFIIKRDVGGVVRFCPMQSAAAVELLAQHDINAADLNTFVLIEEARVLTRSNAALRIARILGWPWKAFVVLTVIPAPIRDIFYRIIAANRYRWFGKRDVCMAPTDDIRARFIESSDHGDQCLK